MLRKTLLMVEKTIKRVHIFKSSICNIYRLKEKQDIDILFIYTKNDDAFMGPWAQNRGQDTSLTFRISFLKVYQTKILLTYWFAPSCRLADLFELV